MKRILLPILMLLTVGLTLISCDLFGDNDIDVKRLLFIDVTPNKSVFTNGDNIKENITVKSFYSDGSEKTLSKESYSTNLTDDKVTSSTDKVTVSYTEGEITKSKTVSISVLSGSSETLKEIKVLSLPTKIKYTENSKFDDNGLVIVGVYSDDSERVITNYTLSLKKGESVGTVDSGDKKTIENTVTFEGKTTTFDITVKKLSSYTLKTSTDWCSSVEKSTITKIIFDYTDNLPSNLKDKLHIHIGNSKDDIIYLIEDETVLYIFSDGIICGNSDCSNMFKDFGSLKEITFNNFDTSKVTNMNSMFINCIYLETLNISSWDTSNVTNMEGMFSNCISIKNLDMSGWNISKVTDMSIMFLNCGKNGTTVTINPYYKDFFDGTELSDWIYTSTIDLGTYQKVMKYTMKKEDSWLPSSVTIGNITKIVFDYTDNLPQNIKDNLTTSTSVGNTDDDLIYLMVDGTELYIFSDGIICGNTDCSEMFKDFRNNEITFNNFNTSNVTDMGYMFCGCEQLTSLDLSNFDTSKVMDMGYMFCGCEQLTSLDLSGFDTSNVEGMNGMFNNCVELTSITFGDKFVTSKVTDMSDMFFNCYNLQSITFGDNFDTSNVTHMTYMFNKCKGLKTLDLSSFDTSKVEEMSYMFDDCNQLTSVKINPSIEINTTNFGSVLNGFTLSGDTYTKTP